MSLIISGNLSKYAQVQIEEKELTDRGAGAERITANIDGDDPEAHKPVELAMALVELVRRLVKPRNARQTAQRFIGLVMHVTPDLLGLSQREAAQQLGLTRASLSKASIRLAEELNLGHARWRKLENSRISYRSAQIRARLYGRHSSQVRKDLKKGEK